MTRWEGNEARVHGATHHGDRLMFATLVQDANDVPQARLCLRSIRAFGGVFADSQICVLCRASLGLQPDAFRSEAAEVVPIEIKPPAGEYMFAYKVLASATAERLSQSGVDSLVWLDCASLCFEPPLLFDILPDHDIALRPVHVRNVGSPVAEPPDSFWSGVYRSVGIDNPPSHSVESFVDKQTIRPYFNCCAYAINPTLGMLGKWWEKFQNLVRDEDFQSGPCSDELHHIFLHQAVFSALITKHAAWNRIRSLPPSYWYPLHLHSELIETGRARTGADVVGILTDYTRLDPIHPFFASCSEPFRAWLTEQLHELSGASKKSP